MREGKCSCVSEVKFFMYECNDFPAVGGNGLTVVGQAEKGNPFLGERQPKMLTCIAGLRVGLRENLDE